jgi:hypothetical protein
MEAVLVDQPASSYSVLGEVRGAGRFAVSASGERLIEAIALAGGLTGQRNESLGLLEREGRPALAPFGAIVDVPANDIDVRAHHTIYVFREPQTFLEFGAVGAGSGGCNHHPITTGLESRGGQFPFGAWRITLSVALDMRNSAEYFLASKFEMRNKGAAVPILDRTDAVAATFAWVAQESDLSDIDRLAGVTDMRIGEAIGLNRNDFDANCGVLTIRDGKFGKSRELPLHRVRSLLVSSEMEVALRSSRTRTTVPSSGLLLWVQTNRRQWHDSPPHRPSASWGIACQGISGKGAGQSGEEVRDKGLKC